MPLPTQGKPYSNRQEKRGVVSSSSGLSRHLVGDTELSIIQTRKSSTDRLEVLRARGFQADAGDAFVSPFSSLVERDDCRL